MLHSTYAHTQTVFYISLYLTRSVRDLPSLYCGGYRGQCYWNRVKAVWLSGDWNVTVSTGSIRPWRWEDSCLVKWKEGLPVAAVATADSCLMYLVTVWCVLHTKLTLISVNIWAVGLTVRYEDSPVSVQNMVTISALNFVVTSND
jgi:hypothetical protein